MGMWHRLQGAAPAPVPPLHLLKLLQEALGGWFLMLELCPALVPPMPKTTFSDGTCLRQHIVAWRRITVSVCSTVGCSTPVAHTIRSITGWCCPRCSSHMAIQVGGVSWIKQAVSRVCCAAELLKLVADLLTSVFLQHADDAAACYMRNAPTMPLRFASRSTQPCAMSQHNGKRHATMHQCPLGKA